MEGRLQRRWDARMAARPRALNDMSPEQARTHARLRAFLLLRAVLLVALLFGLVRIAVHYTGVPGYVVLALVIVAQAPWWTRKR